MAAAGPIASAVSHSTMADAPRLNALVFLAITLASRLLAQWTIRSGRVAMSPRREGSCT